MLLLFRWFVFLIAFVKLEAQKAPPPSKYLCAPAAVPHLALLILLTCVLLLLFPGFHSKCLGNILFVDVGPLGGRHLEVAGVLSKLRLFFFLLRVLFVFLQMHHFLLRWLLCCCCYTKNSFSVWVQDEDITPWQRCTFSVSSKLFCTECGNEASSSLPFCFVFP